MCMSAFKLAEHTHASISKKRKLAQQSKARCNGAGGEGVRVGGVAVRGAPAAVPGGGRRRLRARPHEPRGRRPPPAGLPRPEPLRPGPRPRGRRPHPLRVARDREARAPEAQAGAAGLRLAGGGGDGGRVAGGGGPPVQPGGQRHRGTVHHLAAPRRRAGPGGGGRERGQAQEGAGGLRGAAVGVEVPRRRRHQPRRPQPLPLHALLDGDGVRAAGGGAPPRERVVGGAQGQAGREEGDGAHAAGPWAWKEGRGVMTAWQLHRTAAHVHQNRASHCRLSSLLSGFALYRQICSVPVARVLSLTLE
ncbi:hypothetical protein VPH35_001328 [Triticum aestivum]